MSIDRITALYRIETRFPLEQAAASMAGEQSSGTFRPVPGETQELVRRFGARVEEIVDEGEADAPARPGSRGPADRPAAKPRRALVRLSWSIENTGLSLPAAWTTVAGNLFELSQFSALKLLDVALPPVFATAYPGPAFGVDGTRRLTGVEGRPVIGTIVKPSVGLSPEETADLVDRFIGAGLDFVKDDELIADPPYSPFGKRVAAVMKVVERQADRTGRKAMVAFNVSGEVDDMLRRLDCIEKAGGTCAMLVLQAVGLPSVAAVRRRSAVALHGHRAGWGLYDRSPDIGMSYLAYQRFWRLAGVDHLHVNGIRNKFCEPDASVIASARECLTPLWPPPGRPDTVMPVFSSGQSAAQVADTWDAMRTPDLIFCCGGGIVAHPGGLEAGVASVREAWEAAQSGIPAADYARTHPALAEALESFGGGG
jgi:ribulose-bisphosphate carboxylase large chain